MDRFIFDLDAVRAVFREGTVRQVNQLPDAERTTTLYTCSELLFILSEDADIRGNFYRVLTNDRCDIRHGMLDPRWLKDTCPLDNGQHDDPDILVRSTLSLGVLDILPAEILQTILIDQLDLATLTMLRSVSRSFRHVIDTSRPYNAIVTHAPSSIRAALSLEVASAFSCRELYNTLCYEFCDYCGEFGAYLYLLTCERLCYQCFTQEPILLPMKIAHAKVYWTLTSKDIQDSNIPVAQSLPGYYGAPGVAKPHRGRIQLVDKIAAGDVGERVHGSRDRMNELGIQRDSESFNRWQERTRAWLATPADQRSRSRPARPPYFDWRDGQQYNPNRFMSVLPFPWLDRDHNIVEWGVGCNGCRARIPMRRDMSNEEYRTSLRIQRVLYTKATFIGHFMLCPDVQRIFSAKYADKILGGPKLLANWLGVCDIAGDPSNLEPHWDPNYTESRNVGDVEIQRNRRAGLRQRRRRPTSA